MIKYEQLLQLEASMLVLIFAQFHHLFVTFWVSFRVLAMSLLRSSADPSLKTGPDEVETGKRAALWQRN